MNIISRRGAGKTQLARALVWALGVRGELSGGVVVFSETAGYSGDWAGIGVSHPFSDAVLGHYIEAQKRRFSASQGRGQPPPLLTVVFDDCADGPFHESKLVKWLYTKGRHIRVTIVSLVQFPTQLSPAARNNADHVFVGGQAGDGLKAIFEMISFPGQFRDFERLAWERTRDHAFMCFSAATGRFTFRRAEARVFTV